MKKKRKKGELKNAPLKRKGRSKGKSDDRKKRRKGASERKKKKGIRTERKRKKGKCVASMGEGDNRAGQKKDQGGGGFICREERERDWVFSTGIAKDLVEEHGGGGGKGNSEKEVRGGGKGYLNSRGKKDAPK